MRLYTDTILGDPGAVSGGERKIRAKKSQVGEREKNLCEEKSSRRVRAPGDKVLTDQFQTVGAVLASDWCQKTFAFFCPITEQQDWESFHVFLHEIYVQASCSPYLSGSSNEGLL